MAIEFDDLKDEQIKTRAYVMFCACDIENRCNEVVEYFFSRYPNKYIKNFIIKKRIRGELNLKWKEDAFTKFVKLFLVNRENLELFNSFNRFVGEKGKNINGYNNNFSTIGTNRNSVAHGNINIDNTTYEEIRYAYKECLDGVKYFKEFIEKL